ncbi:hypothetical protein OG596_37555 [Streptomyces sp. NBC_01102]|uniref:hypothetical protein n=1 Tax=Streptomyces sp. NBC_01102 TaxID=2903749 RepID=UPI003867FD7D|nr:hypothetical protein OG596_00365 [Streptomyces sp. NBC_01102]WSU70667.1 hypothetical protein OG596_37555 [Streptomyces sp. NBC_01102]
MSEVASAFKVTAGYTQRVAEDLAVNKQEQERVRADLTRLQGELLQLEESEQVLAKMQDVLVGAGESDAGQGKDGKKASVPAARRGKGVTGQEKAPRRAKSPEALAGKAAPVRGAGEETWAVLAGRYLAGQSEPKSAAEVSAALAGAHPQRKVQATVVRNALEQGVARGLLERSKQGRSVYYSPVTAPSCDEPAVSVQ